MPQLIPDPWFLFLLMSWASLLLIFKQKLISMTPPSLPHPNTTPPKKTKIWTWTW